MVKISQLLPIKKRSVFLDYFGKYNLRDKDQIFLLLRNLNIFRNDLVSKGLTDDDIEGIKLILRMALEGKKHPEPTEGNPRTAEWEQNTGWKIHLNVKLKNHFNVYKWLVVNWKFRWKYLKGGQPEEKVFTIYVGSWDAMEALAIKINNEIGRLLEPAQGETTYTDIKVVGNVYARFDMRRWKGKPAPRIIASSLDVFGVPQLREEFWVSKNNSSRIGRFYRNCSARKLSKDDLEFIKPHFVKSVRACEQLFGVYFYGSKGQLISILRQRFGF